MPKIDLVSSEEAMARDIDWPDIYFTPGYGKAEEAAGSGAWRCVIGGRGEWLLPFHIRGDSLATDAASPYGYAGAYAADSLDGEARRRYWQASLVELRSLGIASLFLRQSPLFDSPFTSPPGRSIVSSHQTFVVRLGESDRMWDSMEGRARTSIRKAQKAGHQVTVRPATAEDVRDGSAFRNLYEGAMGRRGAASKYYFSEKYYLGLLDALGEGLLVGEVRDRAGDVSAAALFFVFGDLMHYHLSGGTVEAGRSGATNLLIWAAAEVGTSRGARRLHLGGGVTNGDGLARFKRSFGGTSLEFDAFGVVVDRARYESALDRYGPGSDANFSFFPAYRRRP